ncbi:klaroid isoform a-related [Anaeramoeba ignava]|uniref:Klaroid isoform a-related n=1 Tax=Anaeramoeba ignava TaxID=1746090 RepID=A0A9Q0RF89_ANAIG|nr:klaroid isoform a-related [Anaeramoeba ignava]
MKIFLWIIWILFFFLTPTISQEINENEKIFEQLKEELHNLNETIHQISAKIKKLEPNQFLEKILSWENLITKKWNKLKMSHKTFIIEILLNLAHEKEQTENKMSKLSRRVIQELFEKNQENEEEFEEIFEELSIILREKYGFSEKEIKMYINKILDIINWEMIDKIDYAAEGHGGWIIGSSPSYIPEHNNKWINFFFGYFLAQNQISLPEYAIQSNTHNKRCWSFGGSYGVLLVHLSKEIQPTHVTLEHLSSKVTPDYTSAPQEFQVWGFQSSQNLFSSPIYLGRFVYKIHSNSSAIQIFSIDQKNLIDSIKIIKLEILSNYGKEYTCLYRFRVHGIPKKKII